MPRLYCEEHGREQEARTIAAPGRIPAGDESVLVASGTLISGPWLCDRCNANARVWRYRLSGFAFPSHCRDDLYDYDFGYERQYFAMTGSDKATAYGADWPRSVNQQTADTGRSEARPRKEPLCALDLRPPKPAG